MRISDWSSDVCSSDILDVPPAYFFDGLEGQAVISRNGTTLQAAVPDSIPAPAFGREDVDLLRAFTCCREIGRGACRGRGCSCGSISVGAVSLQQTKQ